MKIGILTFHSQLNYGGVLQCWALQAALEKLGHEVAVVDRWNNANNSLLEQGYNRYGFKQWVKFGARSLLGLGDINKWRRVQRTKKFIKKHLHLTSYHFVDWKDAPRELCVDMLVIGSDQVWHCGDWNDPKVYLLEGAPNVPTIAYAASFGMVGMPEFLSEKTEDELAEPIYKRGLAKFKAISCRESEGVDICGRLGFVATHVVDPTQLLNASDWQHGLGLAEVCGRRKTLVCYLLSEDVNELLPHLYSFAKAMHCVVKIFLNSQFALPFPYGIDRIKRYVRGLGARLSSRIQILDSAGPREFVDAFVNADWVISDSFHALMFSIVFKKNVRILKPRTKFRQTMFARIEEFAAHMTGNVVVDGVSAALNSFSCGEKVFVDSEWIAARRSESLDYLTKSIG